MRFTIAQWLAHTAIATPLSAFANLTSTPGDDVHLLVGSWWRNDAQPPLAPIDGLNVRRITSALLIAKVAGMTQYEASKRLRDGHRAYIGWLHDQPVAYGWLATRQAEMSEIERRCILPLTDRYLWNIATLPQWHSYDIYPHLLQGIVATERQEAARLWITYRPDNNEQERGISKAGFQSVGAVVGHGSQLYFQPNVDGERANRAAILLKLPPGRMNTQMARPAW